MLALQLLSMCCWLGVVVGQHHPSARLRGDFVIGALFSVHHQPSRSGQRALVCGAIRELYGIQRVETALWTLDQINNKSDILRGVTLGLEARDSCWFAPVALQQSIELVRDAITPAVPKPTPSSMDEQSDSCLIDAPDSERRAPLIGVVGPGSSSVALQVQNLLQLFSIPQIGYSCTSKDLSDKGRYSTFLRVVPSDYYQAQLLVDLVRYFNWTYVSIVNTDAPALPARHILVSRQILYVGKVLNTGHIDRKTLRQQQLDNSKFALFLIRAIADFDPNFDCNISIRRMALSYLLFWI
ncbi:hypothetical protein QAD02_011852 [Eretmocerus hayati]|uniref:Uncharacterized protein n=1 Tax=Eretmocerus hayati TaxID=131215 RepID=A0ACC2NZ47_9HYME|nr:hypothetical protein QAD02_011852 [Eretmocerus hayati]